MIQFVKKKSIVGVEYSVHLNGYHYLYGGKLPSLTYETLRRIGIDKIDGYAISLGSLKSVMQKSCLIVDKQDEQE